MALLATVFLTWLLSVTEPITGEVTYYAPPERLGASSLMKKVWNWRIWKGHVPECPECVDAIALIDPEHIGKRVWIQHPNGEIVGPLMVADCAEAKHRNNLRKRGWIADISWELGRKWKMGGPLDGVTIYFEDPRVPAATPTAQEPERPLRSETRARAVLPPEKRASPPKTDRSR